MLFFFAPVFYKLKSPLNGADQVNGSFLLSAYANLTEFVKYGLIYYYAATWGDDGGQMAYRDMYLQVNIAINKMHLCSLRVTPLPSLATLSQCWYQQTTYLTAICLIQNKLGFVQHAIKSVPIFTQFSYSSTLPEPVQAEDTHLNFPLTVSEHLCKTFCSHFCQLVNNTDCDNSWSIFESNKHFVLHIEFYFSLMFKENGSKDISTRVIFLLNVFKSQLMLPLNYAQLAEQWEQNTFLSWSWPLRTL